MNKMTFNTLSPSRTEIIAHTLYSAGLNDGPGARQGRMKHLDPSLDVTMKAIFHQGMQNLARFPLLDMPQDILRLILEQLSPTEWSACCLLSQASTKFLSGITAHLWASALQELQSAFPNHYLSQGPQRDYRTLLKAQSNFEQGIWSMNMCDLTGQAELSCSAPLFANGKLYLHSTQQIHITNCHSMERTDININNIFDAPGSSEEEFLNAILQGIVNFDTPAKPTGAIASILQGEFSRRSMPGSSPSHDIEALVIHKDAFYTLHSNNAIVTWDLNTSEPLSHFETQGKVGKSIISDRNRLCASRSVSRTPTILIWDIEKPENKRCIQIPGILHHPSLLLSNNLLSLAFREEIQIWDLKSETDQPLAKISHKFTDSTCILKDKIFIGTGEDIKIFDLTGNHLDSIEDASVPRCFTIFNNHLWLTKDKTITVWDLEKKMCITKLPFPVQHSFQFLTAFDGKLCAITTHGQAVVLDFVHPPK